MTLEIAGFVADFCADGINIRGLADKPHTEPMASAANLVMHQDGRSVVLGHQDVHAAVVVKISQRKSARGQL